MPEFNEDSGGFKMKGFSLHQGTQKYTQAKNAAREAAIKGAKELSAESIAKTVESPNKYHTEGHTPKKQVGPKVDPDAPGTPGTPGYEPPVRRSDFEEGSEQQKMFDRNQAKINAKKTTSGAKMKTSSPAKQKWLNRAPEGFDWKGARAKAKTAVKNENFRRNLSNFPTSRDGGTGAAVTDAGEIAAKDKFKKGVKKVAGKIIKKPGKILKNVGKVLKVGGKLLGPASLGVMAYDAYKSGQKHSGGKINPNQKQVIKEGKKKSGGSIMAQGKKQAGSIYKK